MPACFHAECMKQFVLDESLSLRVMCGGSETFLPHKHQNFFYKTFRSCLALLRASAQTSDTLQLKRRRSLGQECPFASNSVCREFKLTVHAPAPLKNFKFNNLLNHVRFEIILNKTSSPCWSLKTKYEDVTD